MLTAYDAPTGRILDEAGVDLVLVGDSLATVILGRASTREVSMDEMIHHAKAVRRGVTRAPLVGDLPFLGYHVKAQKAIREAKRYVKSARLDAVKIEWNTGVDVITRALVRSGIPVMGHVGLTPQYAERIGGLTSQGKDAARAFEILKAAISFEASGAFAVVLECVTREIARCISWRLVIPTIGIGSGPDCDGQVLVFQDLVGLTRGFRVRFVKSYLNGYADQSLAAKRFIRDVRTKSFPLRGQTYQMKPGEFEKFQTALDRMGRDAI